MSVSDTVIAQAFEILGFVAKHQSDGAARDLMPVVSEMRGLGKEGEAVSHDAEQLLKLVIERCAQHGYTLPR